MIHINSFTIFIFVVLCAILLVAGWWARKYAEKKWPDKVTAGDDWARETGDKVQVKMDTYEDRLRKRAKEQGDS